MPKVLLLALVAVASSAHAQDRILLSEVIPALAATDLGAIELGAAPPPGTARIVHRGEVLAALRAVGRTGAGLAIPAAARIERRARVLRTSDTEALVRPALERAAGRCQVEAVWVPERITLPAGTPEARAEIAGRIDTGRLAAVVVVDVGAVRTRVPVTARLSCPRPEVAAGAHVRIVVQIGNVRVTAPGEAREAGRVGDVIRVTNSETGRSLEGRVVDAATVELVR